MKRSWKVAAGGAALATTLVAGGAFAQVANTTPVANTSQKGSLLMFAKIDVQPGIDTIVQIANDNSQNVNVKCYYMNEKKGRVDFEFVITKKQPVWWSVVTGAGSDDFAAPAFPLDGPFTLYGARPNVGELICWAVNRDGTAPINFNHLFGTATVYDFELAEAEGPTAFSYNSWNFKARGVPANQEVLTPGVEANRIVLNGASAIGYDSCPAYLLANVFSVGSTVPSGYGDIYVNDLDMSFIACNQDLRQDYNVYITKLEFTVWNEHETKFTGAWECMDSYHLAALAAVDGGIDAGTSNFSYANLKTVGAQVRVEGVRSTQCVNSVAAGLVGVYNMSTYPYDPDTETSGNHENEIGTTFNSAGAVPGFILWDPQDPIQEKR